MNIEPFLGFDVIVVNGNITPYKKYVPKMKVILKDYTIEDYLFIFPLEDSSHVVLWVQWLVSFVVYTTNHSTLKFKFKSGGREITLQATIKRLEETTSSAKEEISSSMGP